MPARVADLGVRPTPDDVLTVVREALAIVCEQPLSRITPTTSLDDLGADSLARVEVAELVEERLAEHAPHLHIGDADLEGFRTVADAVDFVAARV